MAVLCLPEVQKVLLVATLIMFTLILPLKSELIEGIAIFDCVRAEVFPRKKSTHHLRLYRIC